MEHIITPGHLVIWVIFSILLIISGLIKWYYYRKNKADRIEPGEIMRDPFLADDDRLSYLKDLKEPYVEPAPTKNPVIKLPSVFNAIEMNFIEQWYMEEGILQLKQSNGKEPTILNDKPPVPGCKFVTVPGIIVNLKKRDNKTLELVDIQLPKTVKLLMLDAWIK